MAAPASGGPRTPSSHVSLPWPGVVSSPVYPRLLPAIISPCSASTLRALGERKVPPHPARGWVSPNIILSVLTRERPSAATFITLHKGIGSLQTEGLACVPLLCASARQRLVHSRAQRKSKCGLAALLRRWWGPWGKWPWPTPLAQAPGLEPGPWQV